MLKHMLSGTAIALLLVSTPALAQTDEQAPETEMQDTQTESTEPMESPDAEAPAAGAEEDAGANDMGTTDSAQDDTSGTGDTMDSATEDTGTDTMDSATEDTGTDPMDSAQEDTGMESDNEMSTSVDEPATGDTAAADAGSTETYFTEQMEDEVLASELMDAEVQNAEGEALGNINDVLITETEGVKGVVIGVGGFLGLGTKNVRVNYDEIEQQRDETGNVILIFAATNEELEEAPDFMNLQQKMAESEAQTGAGGTGMGGTTGAAPAPAPAPAE